MKNLLIVILLTVTASRTTTAADCINAPTSEGLIDLPDMHYACAELKGDQSLDELGKSYVQCVHGNLYVLQCSPGLRWDTSINNCNYPERGTCALADKSIVYTSPDEETTSESMGTTKQTTTTRTTSKITTTTDKIPSKETTSGNTRRTRRTTRMRTTPETTTTTERIPSEDTSTTTTTTDYKTTRRSTRTRRTTATTTTTPSEISIKFTTATTTTKAPTSSTRVTDLSTQRPTEKMVESTDCVDVETSEGSRRLQHGQRACAPLGSEEDESDLGRKFVICSSRTVYTQECQTGLRYDTTTGLCNWPEASTCEFEEEIPTDKSGPTIPINKPSTVSRKPTISTQTPRPKASGRCNDNNCKLPDCFCFGDSPSTIPLDDMPMFIMLTFDDAVTSSLYSSYFRGLVVDNEYNLFNPNGCRIKSAFYVSHENTDYSHVKAIWNAGNEIGSHTIHHELPPGNKDSDYPQMVAEIQGLKDEMLEALGNKTLVNSIVGFRAPYLRVAGNVQFDVLKDFGFEYDTSILNINILQGKKPHWPFTLDYVMGECINPPCPTKPYPGLWEVPLNGWVGDDKAGCSMIDACVVGSSSWTATEEKWYNLFQRHFHDYFYPIKVPMPIFTHGFLFANYPHSYPAMCRWFQDLLRTRHDVWLVTPTQVIDWMKNPLSNKEMIAQRWGC